MTAAAALTPAIGWYPLLFSGPMILALLREVGPKTMTRRLVPRPSFKKDGVKVVPGCDACWEASVPHNGEEAILGGPCYLRVPACDHVGLDGYPGGGRIWPKWNIGDRIWVKETHLRGKTPCGTVWYRATEPERIHSSVRWTPSILMPRWASRITLEVTGVKVERLQDITEEDARAEGVLPFFERFPSIGRDQTLTTGERCEAAPYRASFAVLWDELNADRATWKANHWIFATSFRRVTP